MSLRKENICRLVCISFLTDINNLIKNESSGKDFSKCEKMRKKLRVCAHLLKKSLMVNFIFPAVKHVYHLSHSYPDSFEGLNLKNRQVQYFLLTQYTPSIKKWRHPSSLHNVSWSSANCCQKIFAALFILFNWCSKWLSCGARRIS